MQSQAKTDSALAMLGMNEQFASGSARVQKMQQHAEAMEEQYKSLIQKIITSGSLTDPETGTPYLPAKSFLDTVEKSFAALEQALKTEKEDNEGLLTAAHDAVKKCNSDRGDSFQSTIVGSVSTLKGARSTHAQCRNTEDSEIADMETKCAEFDDLADHCNENQDWYAQYKDSSIDNGGAGNTLREVVRTATACKGAVGQVTATANQCDIDQDAFKSSFCAFSTALTHVCSTHANCYNTETGNLASLTTSVKALEKEQKTVWTALGKVGCFLDVLLGATFTNMPTQASITACNGKDINTDVLTITYTPAVAEDPCLEHSALEDERATPKPGSSAWWNMEMKGKNGDLTNHDKLKENSAC